MDKVFECKAGSGSVTLLIIGLHRGCSKLVWSQLPIEMWGEIRRRRCARQLIEDNFQPATNRAILTFNVSEQFANFHTIYVHINFWLLCCVYFLQNVTAHFLCIYLKQWPANFRSQKVQQEQTAGGEFRDPHLPCTHYCCCCLRLLLQLLLARHLTHSLTPRPQSQLHPPVKRNPSAS